jgi:predicted HD superfamily hydrolase involved in NAD metabolism
VAEWLDGLRAGLSLEGGLAAGVTGLLEEHGCPGTAAHCRAVAALAGELAPSAGCDPAAAATAGWLHDVSAVIPAARRLDAARALGLAVLPEEAACPAILHQRLSAVLARELFAVRDGAVLDAIGCHTTLRAGSSALDRVLFVADKVAWDGAGAPPWDADVRAALRLSVDAAALAYLGHLWARRDTLPVVHPWLAEAYAELRARAGLNAR